MSALYVCSPAPGAGKTTVALGLAQRLAAEGLAVGYMKPVGRGAADPDAVFARQVLRLRLPLETLSPIDPENLPADPVSRLTIAYDAVSRDRDVVVLDGAAEVTEVGLDGLTVAEALDARVLVVAPYQSPLNQSPSDQFPSDGNGGLVDSIVATAVPFGDRVLGAVVTAVPETAWKSVDEAVRSALAAAGIPLVGILPVSRALLGLTVAELADGIGGEIICAREWADKPVESLTLATISDTTMQWYFRRQQNKAVIARGDRPDAHIGALETETACLIVTGGRDPQPHVLGMAADLEVPVVKVADDTMTVLDRVTDHLPKVRFRQRHKMPEIARLLEEHFDFAALRRALGLRQEAMP